MPLRLSASLANALAAAARDLVDVGSGPGVVRVYSGSQPATPDNAATGTLLAEFTLADPSYGSPVNGTVPLDATPPINGTGLAAGTAGWVRVLDSTQAAGSGLGVLDGVVTLTAGGGTLTLNTLTVSVGVVVSITGGSIAMPTGA